MRTLDRRTNKTIDYDALSSHLALNWEENPILKTFYDTTMTLAQKYFFSARLPNKQRKKFLFINPQTLIVLL